MVPLTVDVSSRWPGEGDKRRIVSGGMSKAGYERPTTVQMSIIPSHGLALARSETSGFGLCAKHNTLGALIAEVRSLIPVPIFASRPSIRPLRRDDQSHDEP